MHGIYIMAAITSLVGLAAYGAAIWFITAKDDRRMVLLAGALALPLGPLVFYVIRMPIIGVVNTFVDAESNLPLLVFIQLLYAPITEELGKLLPLVVPAIRKHITPQSFVPFAAAIGLGFGIGEVWLVGQQVAGAEQYTGMPFYLFTGFAVERLTVMVNHAFFTAAALWGITRGKAWLGILLAMLLHWVGNAPIALIVLDAGGLGTVFWLMVVGLWTTVYGIVAFVALSLWHFPAMRRPIPKRAWTHARCPECGTIYKHPLLVMNLPTHRYEQCPNCKRWHWIKRWDDPDAAPEITTA